jgi:hypothetical protein
LAIFDTRRGLRRKKRVYRDKEKINTARVEILPRAELSTPVYPWQKKETSPRAARGRWDEEWMPYLCPNSAAPKRPITAKTPDMKEILPAE